MIEVSIRPRLSELKKLQRNLYKVLGRMKYDVRKLGEEGYKHLKGKIPVSSLAKPHLRDSFKVKTEVVTGTSILLGIYTSVEYASFVDAGVSVPVRFPKRRKAMVFDIGAKTIFAKRVRGFSTRGVHYVASTEAWLVRRAPNYIDFSLHRYLT